MNILLIGKGKTIFYLDAYLNHKCDIKIMDYETKEAPNHFYEREIDLDKYDLFIKSNGIRSDDKFIKLLIDKGKKVENELDFSYQRVDKKTKIIAVTGSNGKTSTCKLIEYVLKNKGYKVMHVGNYDYPLAKALNGTYDYLIIEVSSFMLEDSKLFKPDYAIITSISPNHLNFSYSYIDYINFKKKIYQNQTASDYLIVHKRDDFKFDFKCETRKIYPRKIKINNKYFKVKFNNENLMLANEVFKILKIKNYRKLLKNYKGVKYRFEYLGKYKGCKIYNDGKSTSIYATISALKKTKKNTLLILGGVNKNIPYKFIFDLGIKRIVIYGKEGENNLDREVYKTLKEAFMNIIEDLPNYQNLLFSPGFSSLDQYSGYEERSKEFENLCKKYLLK